MIKYGHPRLIEQRSEEGGVPDRVRFEFSIPYEDYLTINMHCVT